MEYEIYFKPSAFFDAARLPLAAWEGIKSEIENLAGNPFHIHSHRFFKNRHKHYHQLKFEPYYVVYKVSTLERAIRVLKISRV